jgi:hypothetical protein
MTYVDTPEARLQAALDAVGDRATYVKVEVIDLRAALAARSEPLPVVELTDDEIRAEVAAYRRERDAARPEPHEPHRLYCDGTLTHEAARSEPPFDFDDPANSARIDIGRAQLADGQRVEFEPRAEGLREALERIARGNPLDDGTDLREWVEWAQTDAYAALDAATPPAPSLDARTLAPALRSWEAHRHPGLNPAGFDGDLDDWTAWEAVAQKLIDAALAPEQPE